MSFVAKSFFFLVVVGLAALLTIQINPTSSTVQLKANDGIFDEASNSIFDEAFDGISNEANDGIFEVPSFDKITPVSNFVLEKKEFKTCPPGGVGELIMNWETPEGKYVFDSYSNPAKKAQRIICCGQDV